MDKILETPPASQKLFSCLGSGRARPFVDNITINLLLDTLPVCVFVCVCVISSFFPSAALTFDVQIILFISGPLKISSGDHRQTLPGVEVRVPETSPDVEHCPDVER